MAPIEAVKQIQSSLQFSLSGSFESFGKDGGTSEKAQNQLSDQFLHWHRASPSVSIDLQARVPIKRVERF
jgi:hypothetical protein